MTSAKTFSNLNDVHPFLNALARLSPWLLVAICLAVLLVFVSLASYAHPSTDDLCMAVGIRRDGLILHLWSHYFEWSGRYSGNMFYGMYPMIFGMFEGYRYIPFILIIILFTAGVFLLSSLFGTKMSDRCVLLSSLCFVCVYLLGMISPASGLYWMAGALTYQPANSLLLVALGLMLRLRRRQERSEHFSMPLILLLIVMAVAIGFNETSMLALTALAALFLMINLRSGRAVWPWLAVFVITLTCFGVVYFSPGNASRAAAFPLRHDLPRALAGSLDVGLRILGIWLGSPVLWASTLLAPFAISRLYRTSDRTYAVSKLQAAIAALCTLAVPVVFQFPAWWAMGGWAPARTIDATYFVFLLGWFLTTVAITVYLHNIARTSSGFRFASSSTSTGLPAAVLLFTLTVLGSDSYRQARADLDGRAGHWDAYMHQRYALITDAVTRGSLSLAVPDYRREYPRTIYFNDIMYDPRDWRNDCYAAYFELDSIRREKNTAD